MSLRDSLPSRFAAALKPLMADATLHVSEWIDDGMGGWSVVTTDYPCRAMADSFSDLIIQALGIPSGDAKIIVMRDGMSVEPTTSDQITLDGVLWAIIRIDRDAAGAAWELQGRRIA